MARMRHSENGTEIEVDDETGRAMGEGWASAADESSEDRSEKGGGKQTRKQESRKTES